MESLRQESTDGVIRTTSISPGFVRTELGDSISDPAQREWVRSNMAEFGLDPAAVARAIALDRTTARRRDRRHHHSPNGSELSQSSEPAAGVGDRLTGERCC